MTYERNICSLELEGGRCMDKVMSDIKKYRKKIIDIYADADEIKRLELFVYVLDIAAGKKKLPDDFMDKLKLENIVEVSSNMPSEKEIIIKIKFLNAVTDREAFKLIGEYYKPDGIYWIGRGFSREGI